MQVLSLFSGIGGFERAAEAIGSFTVEQLVENDPDAQIVLRTHFPGIPIHDDIRTYHCRAGEFDVIWGGFPCTNTSVAGDRTGLTGGGESELWWEMLRIIGECRPRFVVIENPTGMLSRGLNLVIYSLAEIGYVGEWQCISAAHLGATHVRERVFVVSYPDSLHFRQRPARWVDQVRNVVQKERAVARFPALERGDDGTAVRFPPGLDEVPVAAAPREPGRIRSRYLFGRTVVPGCAAVALRRVKYLNSLTVT